MARPGDRPDRTGRHAPDHRVVRVPHAAGTRRPGRGRLQRPARVPSPGRRDRGRPRALRLGARPVASTASVPRSRPATSRRSRSSRGSASGRSASRSTTSTARSWSSSSMGGRPRAVRPSTRRAPRCHDAPMHDADRDADRDLAFDTLAVHAGAEPDELTGAVSPPIYQTSTYAQDGVGKPRRGYEYARLAEPDPRAARTGGRGARGRHARDRVRVGVGGDGGHRRAGRAGRRDRRRGRRLRRDLPLPRARPSRQGRRRPLRRPRRRAGCAVGGPHRADAPGLVRDAVEPAAQGRRHRGDRGDRRASRGRGRPAAARRRRQHVRLAGPPAAADARGGHRLPLRDEVPRRPLGHDRRAWRRPRTTRSPSACASSRTRWAAVPGPLDCFLVLRGLRTLHLRMERHGANAAAVAAFLERRPDVAVVHYPAMGGMVSFLPGGGRRPRPIACRAGDRDRRGDAPVHAGRVAGRRRVAHRAPGRDDPHVGGRLAARGLAGAGPAVGRHRGRRRPDRRPPALDEA